MKPYRNRLVFSLKNLNTGNLNKAWLHSLPQSTPSVPACIR
ncbi:hypothetical protein QWZ13_14885 [Reinekea marina]|nr:hypothetical protein [Reinekea marina]MDN3650202.1 hypothetical protein [Reinekea marina]